MPSLPATDDGSARELAEDLNTGPDSVVITGDGDTETDAAQASALEPAEAELLAIETEGGSVVAGGDSAEAGADSGGLTLHAPPRVGESGRWFRRARTELDFLAVLGDEDLGIALSGVAEPKAPANTEAAAEAEAPAEAEAATEAEAEASAEAEILAEAEAPAEAEILAEAEAPAEAETSMETPTETEATAEVEAPADAEVPGEEVPLPTRTPGVWSASAGGLEGSPGPGVPPRLGSPQQVASPPVVPPIVIRPARTPVVTPGPDTTEGEQEEARGRWRVSRRALLQAGMIGGAGLVALPLVELAAEMSTGHSQQAASPVFSLNGNWLFGGQYMAGSETSFYDDSGFASVTVPHTVTPLSWGDWDQNAWEQIWIYRRRFSGARLLGARHPGNRIVVDFDGVMVNATVVINDQAVSTHQGGYLPWSAELTGHVKAGNNLLAVIVDARNLPVPPVGVGRGPGSIDFFQPGGIYRDVRLRVLPQVFLSDMFALPTDVLTSQRRVDVECTIDSALTTHAPVTLVVDLLDGPMQLASQVARMNADPGGLTTAKLSLTDLKSAQLWSPDSPKLYTVRATLTVPGVGTHVLTRRIGFREASFRPEGFFLNGERLQLFGLNRHQLYPYAGMAMPARVQRRDAEILKYEFNCNMVRCSHYPQSPQFLDACDELGLLVWEEAPGWHDLSASPAWQDLVVQNVRDMVIRDRSRPSVIIWGTRLNETWGLPALWEATRKAAAELDGSRPSSGAMAFHTERYWAEDVYGFNDYGMNFKAGQVHLRPPFPGVPYLITESVGVEDIRPQQFSWIDPPAVLAKQAALHGQAQSQARSAIGYAGMLAWAGFDYGSLQGRDPEQIKWAGVADGFRVPKPGAAIYQSQADPKARPVILPVFFWEPGGAHPAPDPTVMVASNCDRLEVFVGGLHVTSALPAFDSPLYSGLIHPPFLIHLPVFRPGPVLATPELLIRGYVAGVQVTELRMSADTSGDTLSMTADDAAIWADGSDATRVVFRAIDAHGNQRRFQVGQVDFNLSGPATLVGDNPFAFGRYGGLGAVWLRSVAGQTGAITLTASHPQLGQAEIQVRSEPAAPADQLA